jgi:hypothetical protein
VGRRESLDLTGAFAWLVWGLIVTLPALPILAEREDYLATAGVSLGIATLLRRMNRSAWRAPSTLAVVAVSCLFLAHWAGLGERTLWWSRAGALSRQVVATVASASRNAPPSSTLAVYNVPDRLHFAHVQGTHVCWTVKLTTDVPIDPTRCWVRVIPDDGIYDVAAARADFARQIDSKVVTPPIELVVLDQAEKTP